MKNIFITLSALTLIITFSACQADPLEADIPQAPQKLVVSSQLLPGGLFAVTLSRSFTALRKVNTKPANDSIPFEIPEELLVQNADITLRTPSGTVRLSMLHPGIYTAENITVQDYAHYTLHASDPGTGESVTSSSALLPSVFFDTVGVVQESGEDFRVHYRFTDDPATQNWYVINYYTKDRNDDSSGSSNALDIDNIARKMLDQKLDFDLVSEKDLSNGQYSISKKFKSNGLDTFGITLSNISKGYFDFLTQHKRSKMLLNRLKGEVVNLPTNISNGYGYFNLFVPDVRVITLDRRKTFTR